MLTLKAANIFGSRQTYISLIRSVCETVGEHDHDYYEIVLITDGSTVHCVNGRQQLLEKNRAVIIRPSDTHYFEYPEKGDCSFINIAFTCEAMSEICRFLNIPANSSPYCDSPLPPIARIREETVNDMLRIYKEICLLNPDSVQGDTKGKFMAARIMEEEFLMQESSSPLPRWFEKLQKSMCRPEVFSGTLADLSAISGKSAEHICRAFQKYLNSTPMEQLTEKRMDYAANLLRTSLIPITEISLECGYTSLSPFYKRFKEKYGISPASYRKKYRYTP